MNRCSLPFGAAMVLALCAASTSSCSGGGRAVPPGNTQAVVNTPPAEHRDPALADAPADAAFVVIVDGPALRASPLYAPVRQMFGRDGTATGCGADPLDLVERAVFSYDAQLWSAFVLRGAIAAPEHANCRRALFGQSEAQSLEHVGDAVAFAVPTRAEALHTALSGGASANANARLAALHATVPSGGVVALLDFAAVATPEREPGTPLPGLDLDASRRLFRSLHGATLSLTADGDATRVALQTWFENEADARDAGAWMTAQFHATLTDVSVFAAGAGAAADDGAARLQLLALVSRLDQTARFTADGTTMRATVTFGRDDVAAIATFATLAIRTYTERAKTAEAVGYTLFIADQATRYAAERQAAPPTTPPPRRGRRGPTVILPPPSPFPPSAARTPADVPRGVRVVDPAGAWESPSWQALQFSMTDPHYYSYEFINRGSGFTVRAYGDLDGDGTLSTFERSGEIQPTGEVTVHDLVITNELE